MPKVSSIICFALDSLLLNTLLSCVGCFLLNGFRKLRRRANASSPVNTYGSVIEELAGLRSGGICSSLLISFFFIENGIA